MSLSTASIWNGLAMKLLSTRKKVCTVESTPITYGIMLRCFPRLVKTTTIE